MAALFIDLDGTVFEFHTQKLLPSVVDKLTDLAAQGHEINFITMRDEVRDAGTDWSLQGTHQALSVLPFTFRLLSNVQSPRILIDDSKPSAIHAQTNNSAWIGLLP